MKNSNQLQDKYEKQKNILIKTKEKTNQNNNIIILIVVIITLISSVLTLCFTYKLYHQSKKHNDGNEQKVEKFYQTLSTVYDDNSKINIDKIVNNYVLDKPKVITICNEGNHELSFNIKITNVNTNLSNNTNFVYEITKNGETSLPKEIPLSNSVLLNEIKLQAGEKITYLLNIKFNGIIDTTQDTYYYADIEIEQNKTDLLK